MKKLLCSIILSIATFGSGSLVIAESSTASATTAKANKAAPEYLFVLEAKQANITKVNKGYEIYLSGVDKKTLYFSDRPIRKAGFIKTQKFIDAWMQPGSSFDLSPPNAAFSHAALGADNDGKVQAISVELSNPNLISESSIIFRAQKLDQKIKIGTYNDVTIFIDSANGADAFGSGRAWRTY